ncbi:MAG: hypothetical protein C6P35_03370 [Cohnella sp.]|uniref:helix-turn-helix domain-containing protein n=1 Tax=Cohnella sp. TaxID=1883426 RepID=UPI000E3B51B6|nr:helix-turn-helix transcriptional regulator [Cohnella sp.]REK68022.1 MAG: hypothetical protein C6P35_03370 [Cohnella sp.]
MLTFEPLRIYAAKHRLNPIDLARRTGLTRQTIYKMLDDKSVSMDAIDKVCTSLDLELHEVVRRKREGEE